VKSLINKFTGFFSAAFLCVIIPLLIYYSLDLFENIDFNELMKLNINIIPALISIGLFTFSLYFKGLVFSRELAEDISALRAFRIMCVGETVNMIVPFKLGEGIKKRMLPEKYGFLQKTVITTVPKLFDILALIIFSLLSLVFYSSIEEEIGIDFLLYIGIILGVIIFAIMALRLFPSLNKKIKEFIEDDIAGVLIFMSMSWILIYFSIACALLALNLPFIAAFKGALGVIVATNISMLIPGTPGGIGYFEFMTAVALSNLIENKTYLLAAALFIHLIQYVAVLPAGLFMFLFGKRFKKYACKTC